MTFKKWTLFPIDIELSLWCLMMLSVTWAGCSDSAGGINIWDAVNMDDDAKVVKYVQAGGNVNARKVDGTTPLFMALVNEKRKCFEKLLELGADPNIISRDGRVVVHYAAARGDSTWLRLALDHGGDPNLLNEGAPGLERGVPLIFAIRGRSLESVTLLVERGAELDARDDKGRTALVHAMLRNQFDIAHLLLERGADYTIEVKGDNKYLSFLSVARMKVHQVPKLLIPEDRHNFELVRQWLLERNVDITEENEVNE